jgi:hypothetical protein
MAFSNILQAAKKAPPLKTGTAAKLIDGDTAPMPSGGFGHGISNRNVGRNSSTNGSSIIRGIMDSRKSGEGFNVSWERCKHLKQSGNSTFCTVYFSLCAKNKCPKPQAKEEDVYAMRQAEENAQAEEGEEKTSETTEADDLPLEAAGKEQ